MRIASGSSGAGAMDAHERVVRVSQEQRAGPTKEAPAIKEVSASEGGSAAKATERGSAGSAGENKAPAEKARQSREKSLGSDDKITLSDSSRRADAQAAKPEGMKGNANHANGLPDPDAGSLTSREAGDKGAGVSQASANDSGAGPKASREARHQNEERNAERVASKQGDHSFNIARFQQAVASMQKSPAAMVSALA